MQDETVTLDKMGQ